MSDMYTDGAYDDRWDIPSKPMQDTVTWCGAPIVITDQFDTSAHNARRDEYIRGMPQGLYDVLDTARVIASDETESAEVRIAALGILKQALQIGKQATKCRIF